MFKNKKLLMIVVSIVAVVALVILGISLYLSYQSQEIRQQAWQTEQSVIARCDQNGNVEFSVSFTNTEPTSSNLSMNVIAKDSISGKTVNLGSIRPGESKSGTISIGSTTTAKGTIRFDLTWTSGRSGTDVRAASYSTLTCAPPATASPSPTPTVTPSPTPTTQPTPTPTLKPTPTPVPACNSACVTSEDCLSGMSCVSGACRTTTCTSSTTCLCATPTPTPTVTPSPTPVASVTPSPTPVLACNSLCTTDTQCPSDLICSSGYCRRPGCTAVDSCNCGPVVTPTPLASTPEPTVEPLPQAGSVAETVTVVTAGVILLMLSVFAFTFKR